MINFTQKMPVVKVLLFFSCLIIACGVGIGVGGLWMLFKFKDVNSFIYGFLILIGSLFLAALIRMFADMGQIMFDLRLDIQRSSRQANELNEKLIQGLQTIIGRLDKTSHDSNALDEKLSQELRSQLQLQADALNQSLQAIIGRLDKTSHDSNALDEKLSQELRSQLQLQADALNQVLQTIIGRLDKTSHEANELDLKLNKELKDQLQLQIDNLNQKLQLRAGVLNQGLQAVIDKLDKTSHEANELGQIRNQDLRAIIDKLDKTSHEANALAQKIAAIKDNSNQLNLNSKDINQNINQIRIFFERIEKHLDLKK